MIKRIDHIIIHTSDHHKTCKEIEEAFGLIAPPVMEFGVFASAMFTFGNVNIEVLKLGDKKEFKPYLYGIAFESHKKSWELLSDLKKLNIEHTLPMTQETQMVSWTNTMLKGLLDNAMPTNYGIYSNSTFNKLLSKFFGRLMDFKFVQKAAIKDVGNSMIFFCEYDDRIKAYNEYSQKVFSAFKGGTYGIKGVEGIAIEKSTSNERWKALGSPRDKDSVKFEFIDSARNKLDHIILNAKEIYNNKEIMIGDVRFVIR